MLMRISPPANTSSEMNLAKYGRILVKFQAGHNLVSFRLQQVVSRDFLWWTALFTMTALRQEQSQPWRSYHFLDTSYKAPALKNLLITPTWVENSVNFPSSILAHPTSLSQLTMIYEPLPSPTSTRLIKLLPGALSDPLVCELQIIDLDSEDLGYPAISYVWGDPDHKKPIQCMQETLMIPTSL